MTFPIVVRRFLFVLLVSCASWTSSGACSASMMQSPTPRQTKGHSIAEGEHFRVECHFVAPKLAKDSLAVLEDYWLVAHEFFMLSDRPLSPKLIVHLYRDAKGYEAAEAALTGGRFKRNLAFAHPAAGAHIALQPPVKDSVRARIGLTHIQKTLLRHEATHLIRFRGFNNCRSHPDWFATGAAMWLRQRAEAEAKDSLSLAQVPDHSTGLLRVKRLSEKNELPSVAEILSDDLDSLDFFQRYDVRWIFFKHLMEGPHRKRMKRFLQRARQLGGGSGYAQRLHSELVAALGKQGFDGLDRSLQSYAKTLKPEWEEVFRNLDPVADGWLQIAWPNRNALTWRCEGVGKSTFQIEAEIEILDGTKRQMNLLLGRSDTGFVSVAFTAGYGVNVFDYRSKGNKWKLLERARVPSLSLNSPINIRVEVKEQQLEVFVGGKSVLKADLGALDLSGPYGLGVQAGGAGYWRHLKLK